MPTSAKIIPFRRPEPKPAPTKRPPDPARLTVAAMRAWHRATLLTWAAWLGWWRV